MYSDVANAIACSIKEDMHERGILICEKDIGVAIATNKLLSICVAQRHDTFSSELAKKSNNAQFMIMGAKVIGLELAKKLMGPRSNSEFESRTSTAKVERINHYDQLYST